MNTETLTVPELLALTNGHPPHREDGWTRDMLEEGWRPLILGEPYSYYDQMMRVDFPADSWTQCCGAAEGYLQKCRIRTRRPAPSKPAEEVAKPGHAWDNCAEAVRSYLKNCDAEEKWPQLETLREIFIQHFSPIVGIPNVETAAARLATSEQEVSRLTRERDEAKDILDEICEALPEDSASRRPDITGVAIVDDVKDLVKWKNGSFRKEMAIHEIYQKQSSNLIKYLMELGWDGNCPLIGSKTNGPDAWYRDFVEKLKSRAESAEAQLATLRGELEVALVDQELLKGLQNDIASYSQQTADAISSMVEHRKEIDRLQKQLAAHTWTPTSERMPTEADGVSITGLSGLQFYGMVIWGTVDFECFGHFDKKPEWATHWMPAPPLPTQPELEARKECRRVFEEWAVEAKGLNTDKDREGDYVEDTTEDAWSIWLGAWQASREGGGK